ncbi:MAG: M23 family metallopeptidase [Alphaproteobacteria bacterium]|nr:M23 family metallopeptidase [Alphaproteobacteria bacterium]
MILQKNKLVSISLLLLATLIASIQHKYSYKLNYDNNSGLETYDDIDEDDDAIETDEGSYKEQDKTKVDKNVTTEHDKDITKVSDIKNSSPVQNNNYIIVKKNENIYNILCKQGVPAGEALKASSAISKIFKLKNIRTGLKILINTKMNNNIVVLEKLEFKPSPRYKIIVSKNKYNEFVAVKEEAKLKKVIHNVSGTINPKSIKHSLQKCNMNKKMEKETVSVLKSVTNISSCKKPINFDLVYEKHYDEENNIIDNKFLYISAVIDGRIKRIYKFNNDGIEEYIYSDGTVMNSNTGSMFIQPIIYKKISSPFGLRVHPITGKSKIHTGVDLKANIGTPVKASASGTVTKASYFSGYGNYININHAGGLKTAYAHLSKILVRNGQYVKQGQIIAYSGNSGNSTGPHLHYEVMKNGRYINPLSFVPKQPKRLIGKKLSQFNQFKNSLNHRIAQLNTNIIKI